MIARSGARSSRIEQSDARRFSLGEMIGKGFDRQEAIGLGEGGRRPEPFAKAKAFSP